jgi:hypothetical protein
MNADDNALKPGFLAGRAIHDLVMNSAPEERVVSLCFIRVNLWPLVHGYGLGHLTVIRLLCFGRASLDARAKSW